MGESIGRLEGGFGVSTGGAIESMGRPEGVSVGLEGSEGVLGSGAGVGVGNMPSATTVDVGVVSVDVDIELSVAVSVATVEVNVVVEDDGSESGATSILEPESDSADIGVAIAFSEDPVSVVPVPVDVSVPVEVGVEVTVELVFAVLVARGSGVAFVAEAKTLDSVYAASIIWTICSSVGPESTDSAPKACPEALPHSVSSTPATRGPIKGKPPNKLFKSPRR